MIRLTSFVRRIRSALAEPAPTLVNKNIPPRSTPPEFSANPPQLSELPNCGRSYPQLGQTDSSFVTPQARSQHVVTKPPECSMCSRSGHKRARARATCAIRRAPRKHRADNSIMAASLEKTGMPGRINSHEKCAHPATLLQAIPASSESAPKLPKRYPTIVQHLQREPWFGQDSPNLAGVGHVLPLLARLTNMWPT